MDLHRNHGYILLYPHIITYDSVAHLYSYTTCTLTLLESHTWFIGNRRLIYVHFNKQMSVMSQTYATWRNSVNCNVNNESSLSYNGIRDIINGISFGCNRDSVLGMRLKTFYSNDDEVRWLIHVRGVCSWRRTNEYSTWDSCTLHEWYLR